MRLKRLPPDVAEALGVRGHKQEAPYLKKVQELHCDRLTYHGMCPEQCQRCAQRLLVMAHRMQGDTDVGVWHNIVADVTTDTIEIETDRRKQRDLSSAGMAHGMARHMLIDVEGIRGTLETSGARDREAIGREEDTPTWS